MSTLLDTFMNIVVFAFIGLLVWLYFKPIASEDHKDSDRRQKGSNRRIPKI